MKTWCKIYFRKTFRKSRRGHRRSKKGNLTGTWDSRMLSRIRVARISSTTRDRTSSQPYLLAKRNRSRLASEASWIPSKIWAMLRKCSRNFAPWIQRSKTSKSKRTSFPSQVKDYWLAPAWQSREKMAVRIATRRFSSRVTPNWARYPR